MKYKDITSVDEAKQKLKNGWSVKDIEEKDGKVIFHMVKDEVTENE